MQERLVSLLSIVADEEVTSHLLLLNDEMNNVNEKYKRYMGNRAQKTLESSATSKSAELIDFGSENKSASTYDDNKAGADQASSLGGLVNQKGNFVGGSSGQSTPAGKEPELNEVQDWFRKQVSSVATLRVIRGDCKFSFYLGWRKRDVSQLSNCWRNYERYWRTRNCA